jgi:NAD(P)H-dependent flavin oxidoreductase YrpB (nitropropane dioxygenase family)
MQTSFTRLVGIEHPIAKPPIGGLSVPPLAAAVSSAGGLGMMAITWLELDDTRDSIAALAVGRPERGTGPRRAAGCRDRAAHDARR